ncbi:MAG: hypothetical protein ACFE0O_02590 [Opitutales bacterium]
MLLVAGLVFLTLLGLGPGGAGIDGIDDAQISFVYGDNLRAGHGFVYNADGPPVEGFSSLLWVLLAATVQGLPAGDMLFLLANLILVALGLVWFQKQVLPGSAGGGEAGRTAQYLVAALWFSWVLAPPGNVFWMMLSQMETGVWTGLLLALFLLTHRICFPENAGGPKPVIALSGVIGLLMLTRPEALAWVPLILGTGWLAAAVSGKGRQTARRLIPGVVTFIAAGVGLLLFRLTVFGLPLPNTYYAKLGGGLLDNLSDGTGYLLASLRENPVLILVLTSALIELLRQARTGFREQEGPSLLSAQASLLVMAGTGLAVSVGGDNFPLGRFLLPVWFLGFIPVQQTLLRWFGPFGKPAPLRFGGLWLVVALVWLLPAPNWIGVVRGNNPLGHEFGIARYGLVRGEILKTVFPFQRPDIGVITAGGIARTYDGEVVDLLGLNDTRFSLATRGQSGIRGHRAFSREVFFNIRPDLILPAAVQVPTYPDRSATWHPDTLQRTNEYLRGLLSDPAFHQAYQWGYLSLPDPGGDVPYEYQVSGYIRRDTWKAWESAGYRLVAGPAPLPPRNR